MIKIRLSKRGAKNSLFYRIVAINEKKKATGKHIEILGYYNPTKKVVKIDNDKYKKWVSFGAQVSGTVKSLLKK